MIFIKSFVLLGGIAIIIKILTLNDVLESDLQKQIKNTITQQLNKVFNTYAIDTLDGIGAFYYISKTPSFEECNEIGIDCLLCEVGCEWCYEINLSDRDLLFVCIVLDNDTAINIFIEENGLDNLTKEHLRKWIVNNDDLN